MDSNIINDTETYDVYTEIDKIISFRNNVIQNEESSTWEKLTYNDLINLPCSLPHFTREESESYQLNGGTHFSEIKNISQQESAFRFRRWRIEKSLVQKGLSRKKYQDLSKSMEGKFSNSGSASYIENNAASKLASGWEEFLKEDLQSPDFEMQLLAAKSCIPEASAVINNKLINLHSSLETSQYRGKNDFVETKRSKPTDSTPELSQEAIISDEDKEDKVISTQLKLRMQLKKLMKERQREREREREREQLQLKEQKIEQEKKKDQNQLNTNAPGLTVTEENDDLYQPDFVSSNPTQLSNAFLNSSFPVYSDNSPNAPEQSLDVRKSALNSKPINPTDYDEIDACYDAEERKKVEPKGLTRSNYDNELVSEKEDRFSGLLPFLNSHSHPPLPLFEHREIQPPLPPLPPPPPPPPPPPLSSTYISRNISRQSYFVNSSLSNSSNIYTHKDKSLSNIKPPLSSSYQPYDQTFSNFYHN